MPMSAAQCVLDLRSCDSSASHLVGGKATGLGRLMMFGFDVPPGFAVTTDAFQAFVDPFRDELDALLAEGQSEQARRVRELFRAATIPTDVADEVVAAYRGLGASEPAPVAIRSSAIGEDGSAASFAGQQDTFLWTIGHEAVLDRLVDCWASLYTDRAVTYRASLPSPEDPLMCVVVQQMVDAASAGVMMTLGPASGDRGELHIESSFGLGESVVSGEVSPDVFRYDKQLKTLREARIAKKTVQHVYREGLVVREEIPTPRAQQPSLPEQTVLHLAGLGVQIEASFGRPMDIEWAVDEGGSIHVLQARPETVWSRRPAPATVDDPLTGSSDPLTCWTRSNVGEAAPGVMTPLSWEVWRDVAERAIRDCARDSGALSGEEAAIPLVDAERYLHVFHGRLSVRAQYLATLGDRMPGVTGEDMIRGIFGRVPEGLALKPTRRRYPHVALRMTRTFASFPRRARELTADYDQWWTASIAQLENSNREQAIELFKTSMDRFYTALHLQSIANILVVTPVYMALEGLVAEAGVGDATKLSGAGHGEIEIIRDIWRASRDMCQVEDIVARHGFHGPLEGELSSRVWRDDPSPLIALIEQYRTSDESESPLATESGREALRVESARQLLAALPWHRRPGAKLLLRLGRTRIPMRGIVKRSFLQAIDVGRASARRLGSQLVEAGHLRDVDDVFFLSVSELTEQTGDDLQDLVDARRRAWMSHQQLEVPTDWQGSPFVSLATDGIDDSSDICGLGVSSGIIEGQARVLLTPDFSQVRPGDILVAPTTDPSWSTAMFVSSGLVVDIGGALSHAAVVARELDLPCVVNTRSGTRRIQTGDRIRVDGGSGEVVILDRLTSSSVGHSAIERQEI